MNELRLVDADSQFTSRFKPELPELADSARFLMTTKALSVGHRSFGEKHHLFSLMLRNSATQISSRINASINAAVQKAFSSPPDIVIYPGESTIAYLMKHITLSMRGFPDHSRFLLNPAFHAYASQELRLELRESDKKRLRSLPEIRVLFLDDIIDSGMTHLRAMEGCHRSISALKKNMAWLSYTILKRGMGPNYAFSASVQPGHPRIESFSQVLLKSWQPKNCPLCAAAERLERAIKGAPGARSLVLALLERTRQHFREIPLEKPSSSPELLEPEDSERLLRLFNTMPSQVAAHILSAQPPSFCTIADAIYVAINYIDLRSYLPSKTLNSLIVGAVCHSIRKKSDHSFILGTLACMSTAQLSIILPELLEKALELQQPDLSASIAVLAATNYTHAQGQMDRDFASKRQAAFLLNLRQGVQHYHRSQHKDDSTHNSLLSDIDLMELAQRPEPVRVAGQLAVLLEEGRHAMFLSKQLARLSESTLESTRMYCDQVLELLKQLSSATSAHLDEKIMTARADINASAERKDVQHFERTAKGWLESLWKSGPIAEMISRPLNIERIIHQEIDALQMDFGISPTLYSCHCPASEIVPWLLFTPREHYLRDHIRNLLINPLKHFDPEVAFDDLYDMRNRRTFDASSAPIVQIFWWINDKSIHLAFVDRARPTDSNRVFDRISGLAGFRALQHIHQGDFVYTLIKDSPEHIKRELSDLTPEMHLYNNAFITIFPLLVETRH